MSETLQLCEHHVPVKFGCTRCIEKALYEADSNQLDLITHLQGEIDKFVERIERLDNEMRQLTNMYKNISIVIKHSQESHHRQADEIRKISCRLDDIDKKIIDNS